MQTRAPNDARLTKRQGPEPCLIFNPIPDHQKGIPFMKHPTAKPSEGVMRFFTPELYLQFNSSDDEEADRADEAWESAIGAYRRHLESIRDKMPSAVRKLTELCLHDAELVACNQDVEPFFAVPLEPLSPGPIWSAVAVLSLKHNEHLTSLIYLLWDRLREYAPKSNWRFAKERKHWLYDEVDSVSGLPGRFVHRILFSDGYVTEVPFLTVVIHSFALREVAAGAETQRTA
jgi:hypothetical protein